MKSQLFGLVMHAAALMVCVLGGAGYEVGENLFTVFAVLFALFGVGAVMVMNDDNLWVAVAPGSKRSLRLVVRSLIGLQVLGAFAFGWFVIGGVYLSSLLLVIGRRLSARIYLGEVQ